MALSFGPAEFLNLGTVSGVILKVTFPNPYTSGGETINPKDLGLGQILMLNIIQGEDGYVFEWDSANSKILVRESAATNIPLPEVGAVDLTAVVVEIFAIGR
jgi:hypothetical protein